MLLLKNHINFRKIEITTDLELVAIEITTNQKILIIILVYLPPPVTISLLEKFSQTLYQLTTNGNCLRPILMVGDFNISEFTKHNVTSSRKQLLLNIISFHNLYQYCTTPNRGNAILDLIFTNINIQFLTSTYNFSSDHKSISIKINHNYQLKQIKSITKLNLRKTNWDKCLTDLADKPLNTDPNISVNSLFTQFLHDNYLILNNNTPKFTHRNSHFPPWYTQQCINLLKKKKKIHHKLTQNNLALPNLLSKYHSIRTKFNHLVNYKKKQYLEHITNSLKQPIPNLLPLWKYWARYKNK